MLLLRAGVEPRHKAISLTNARHLFGDNQREAVVSINIANIYQRRQVLPYASKLEGASWV